MTEAEWLACDDPTPMLAEVQGRISERKIRLFCCSYCRHIWDLLPDVGREAVFISERYADGEVGRNEVLVAQGNAEWHSELLWEAAGGEMNDQSRLAAYTYFATNPSAIEIEPSIASQYVLQPAHRLLLCQRLLCIIGNPLRLVTLPPAWLTRTVAGLAATTYEERSLPSGHLDSARLTVLADALEEAGCSDPDILNHLRSPGPHVRGCWALDLLLAKE